MAQNITLPPGTVTDLADRWRADLERLARENDREGLRREEVAHALSAVRLLASEGSTLAAPVFADLSWRAKELGEQMDRAPRVLRRSPVVTAQLAERDA